MRKNPPNNRDEQDILPEELQPLATHLELVGEQWAQSLETPSSLFTFLSDLGVEDNELSEASPRMERMATMHQPTVIQISFSALVMTTPMDEIGFDNIESAAAFLEAEVVRLLLQLCGDGRVSVMDFSLMERPSAVGEGT